MGNVFFVKSGKWGVFCEKSGKWGVCFFCKKVDLSSMQGSLCTVSVFFILHFTYLGEGTYAPNAPPCLRACHALVRSFARC